MVHLSQANEKIDLSIIVVNYNTKRLLLEYLQSVCETVTDLTREIIVVDNASSDGSVEAVKMEFPDVQLIVNSEGLGFARAANLALARGKGRYFLITHPDIKLLPGTTQSMYDFLERHPKAGIVGANLLYPDGSYCSCAYRRHSLRQDLFDLGYAAFRKLIKRFSWLKSNFEKIQNTFYWDHQATIESNRIWNACMMFKREVLETIGNFYEGFYIWFADTDWSYRAKKAGWQLYYLAEAKVIHYEKQSANYIDSPQIRYKVKPTLVQRALNKDRYLFLRRQHSPIFLWLRKGIDTMLSFRLALLALFDSSYFS